MLQGFLKFLKYLSAAVAVIFLILWIRFPAKGEYERWGALLPALTVLFSEIIGRKINAPQPVLSKPNAEKSSNSESIEIPNGELPKRLTDSTVFFSRRFGHAFPGVRGIKWFEGRDAVKRLAKLFESPIVLPYEGGVQIPIWWWRDGNMPIESFKVLNGKTVLLDYQELPIARIAAVQYKEYHRSFVYVEIKATSPTGLYSWSKDSLENYIKEIGYAREEYGLYKKKFMIRRAEYDDGAAVIKGKLVQLNGKAEIRVRYLSRYNLVIAPNNSPINNNNFDFVLEKLMNGMLNATATIEDLMGEVAKLPKCERY